MERRHLSRGAVFLVENIHYSDIILMRKKKVLIHSNHSKSHSGFGRHTKALLSYLHKTGKYDLVEFCTGLNWNNDSLKNMPWKAQGTLPDSDQEWMQILQGLNQHDREIKKRDV